MDKNTHEKNKRLGLMIFGVIVFMVALSFASVPLYDMFCRVTGFGGTPLTANALPTEILNRKVSVKFVTSTSRNMPWDFKSEESEVTLNIGQDALINFVAYNPTKTPVVGTAIYNVTPQKAGKYFHKTQCFCFDRQTLLPKQKMNMPVVFFIDPSIQDDPDMVDVTTITLSYTFFKSNSQELEQAMENL